MNARSSKSNAGGDADLSPGSKYVWFSPCGLLLVWFVLFDLVLLALWEYGGDWSPLWTAGQVARMDSGRLYDFAYITQLQIPLIGDFGPRPFVYPPSALLLFVPLSFLPFWPSFLLLSAGSAIALMVLASRSETDRVLLLMSPPVVFAAMVGQPTLLVAALIVAGLMSLPRQEVRAGMLLGLAVMIKPTLLVMVPVALLAGRHWRAIGGGMTAAVLMIFGSILLTGTQAWLAWIEAVSQFRALFESAAPLYRNGITPYALTLRLELDWPWLNLALLPLVCAATALAFWRTREWSVRMAALIGGSLLVSPYAMNYELAALAPAVLTMPRRRLPDLLIPAVWAAALFVNASLLGLLAAYGWALVRACFPADWSANQLRVQVGIDVAAGQNSDQPRAERHLTA